MCGKKKGRGARLVLIGLSLLGVTDAKANSLVVGGSGLLTQSGANQLAAALGEGDLTLTNVFAHGVGDGKTATTFHTSVDGLGRTFSVLEVTAVGSTSTSLIVGGYDPQSWNSSGNYNNVALDIQRTAFLFNLTSSTTMAEKLGPADGNAGMSQTANDPGYGPWFGGGSDLRVNASLTTGFAYQFSYGPTGQAGTTIFGAAFGGGGLTPTYARIEVFTITDGVPAPLPATALAGAVLMGGIGLLKVTRHRVTA